MILRASYKNETIDAVVFSFFTTRHVHTAKEGGPLKIEKRDQYNMFTLRGGDGAWYYLK